MNKTNVMLGVSLGMVLLIASILIFIRPTNAGESIATEVILEPKPITNTTKVIGTLEKVYDISTETVTINNYLSKEQLTTIKLNTPIKYDVGIGYQLIAKYTCFNSSYCLPKEIKFYDLKNDNKEITKSIDYKYLSKNTKNVTEYSLYCSKTANKDGNYCNPIISGYHLEDEWLPFSIDTRSSKEITIGLFTNVSQGEYVEWIPVYSIDSTDVKISEWASYNAVGKVYYKTFSPHASYADTGNAEFTDGVYPPAVISNAGWFGWQAGSAGQVGNITVDLNPGETVNVNNITAWALTNTPSGVYLPTTTVWGSNDNSTFTNLGSLTWSGSDAGSDTVRLGTVSGGTSGNYRYIRYKFISNGEWVFLGEGGINYTTTATCNFSGYVKDASSSGLQNAQIVVFNQDNKSETYNTTSSATGYWTINITNSTKNFTAVAYLNNSLIGQAKPFISGTC